MNENETKRRTIRRYAHELYPEGPEGESRPLAVEVPYLLARTLGLSVWGTSWSEMLKTTEPDEVRRVAFDRSVEFCQTGQIAMLADALLQGMCGQEAWDWAEGRSQGDNLGEWAYERAVHYGIDPHLIKPYPCGPEPAHHDHMESTGTVLGDGIITRINCAESECPDCTEPIEPESEER